GLHAGGAIELDSTLADLAIDDVPPLTAQEKEATVRDLLQSRSGVYHAAAKEPADMNAERPARGCARHGEGWWYNNWDFNTLGVIFEQRTRTTIGNAFATRLAEPLGMEDFRVADVAYELEPSSSIHPAYAFRVSALDLARFGQLWLQRGAWN